MTQALTPETFLLFERLTRRPLLVVDTEFCITDAGEHIISVAVVPIIRGKRERPLTRVMNPGVPIDASTAKIHGFTDEAVANKRTFAHYAPAILASLRLDEAVFVNHTNTDVRVLNLELSRLADGQDDGDEALRLPQMPLLDTSLLARQLDYPNVGRRTITSLTTLCELTGVARGQTHDARADATATADALLALLRHAASTGLYADIDDLLDDHDRGDTRQPKSTSSGIRRDPGIELSEAHLALHATPLTHAGTQAELDAWLDLAQACIAAHCEHLADEARVTHPHNGRTLFDGLTALLPTCTKPGEAGTLAGALAALLPPAPLTLDEPVPDQVTPSTALPNHLALRWLTENEPALETAVRCGDTASAQCPSCRRGEGCWLDLLYVPVTFIQVVGRNGTLSFERVEHLIGRNATTNIEDRTLGVWLAKNPRAAALLGWFCYAYVVGQDRGKRRQNIRGKVLKRITDLQLWQYEPRVMRLACETNLLLATGFEVDAAVRKLLDQRTSDPAFTDLGSWLVWLEHSRVKPIPQRRKPISNPRLARPDGRHNHNPYLPG